VGVNEIGEAFDEITLPSVAEHTVVSGIASQAFANSNLKTVVVPPTIRYIKDGAFKDSRINRVYMESTHPSSINISWNGGLVEGTVSDFLIYVPEKAFSAYNADYYWGPYGQYLRKY